LRVIRQAEDEPQHFEPATEQAPALDDSRSYDQLKRAIDVAVSAAALAVLLPLMAIISLLVLINIGSPVLFWQQRVGRNGRSFTLYKIRTLGAPFDRRGRPLSYHERLSKLGKLIRKTHLDECPQLVSVLRGDMSLIGPRPLLPVDQPANPAVRLMVRPGITGWAQIHGGKDVSVADKVELDEWYVRNMSLGLDLRILLLTLPSLWRGVVRDTWIGDAVHAHHRLGADGSR